MECAHVPVVAGALGMKICQICAVDFTLEKFLLPLIDDMSARGWDVTSVCSSGSSVPRLRARGYKIETVPIQRSLNPIYAVRSVLALALLFHKEKYDVVHVHTPVAAMIGRIAAFLARVPLVVYTAHGFYFHDAMPKWKYHFYLQLERALGVLTDLIFCQSAEDAACAVREGFVEAKNVMTIGNGVDISQFNPVDYDATVSRKELGIPADAFVIGMIGRLVQEKGVGDFVRAAIQLGVTHKHVWFVLIGERLSSDHNQSVDRDIDNAKQALGSRLILLGQRKDIPALLAAMDVFCLPSWREGMPRTIIEAMMMGKPVVATNIRGAREEVVHEQTGLLIPMRSPEKLAQSLERLIKDPSWGISAGQQGRLLALQHFDEASVIQMQVTRIEQQLEQLRR